MNTLDQALHVAELAEDYAQQVLTHPDEELDLERYFQEAHPTTLPATPKLNKADRRKY